MKRVAVITRHAIINYGSLLQAIATQSVVEQCGCQCRIIDYIREDEYYRKIDNTQLKNKSNWNKSAISRFIYLLLRKPETIIAGKKFSKMQRQYLKLTRRYRSNDELRENCPEADIYMTGSDQVWGPVADGSYDGSYFLDFVSEKKKVAFSSSVGRTEISKETSRQIENWLYKYDIIAVRENSAVKLLNSFGIHAEQVLDPTLLLNEKQWGKYICKKVSRDMRNPYVLVYQIHNDAKLSNYAKEFAKLVKLPLIRITPTLHQIGRGGRLKYAPDLGEFLAYIKNATYMITDSFHGTAFAINFNTQFIEILPNNNTGSRNQSILRLTGLQDRIITNLKDFSIKDKTIDFTYANQVLEEERKKTKKVLNKCLDCGGYDNE